jgi:hypothetical protein
MGFLLVSLTPTHRLLAPACCPDIHICIKKHPAIPKVIAGVDEMKKKVLHVNAG